MEPIKETVASLMEGLKTKKQKYFRDNPEELLKKVLTKKQLQHIKFKYFRKGILGISVDSSTWLYFLNLQKEDLLVKLSDKFAGIKDIRFSIG
jgi:aspartate carbamoyltransferase catalytic subunit